MTGQLEMGTDFKVHIVQYTCIKGHCCCPTVVELVLVIVQ